MANQPENLDRPFNSNFNATWHHTMLRIKDPSATVPFYKSNFGMNCFYKFENKEYGYTSYFMEKFKNGTSIPDMNSPEAEKYLMNTKTTMIEFVHFHGTEYDENYKVNNGNVEPYRGFGHIAFHVDNVDESFKTLDSNGVKFQKKPWEGRMKNLAFALDPDGYWIEIINRNSPSDFEEDCNLSQTMIRVKDPVKSLKFYTEQMGMTLILKRQMETFSLYFLASIPSGTTTPDPQSEEAHHYVKAMWGPCLELTHNHGTETDDTFSYHNGNRDPKGFGYLSFLVDDVTNFSDSAERAGFKKIPYSQMGKSKNTFYIADPDNYYVQVVKRGSNFNC